MQGKDNFYLEGTKKIILPLSNICRTTIKHLLNIYRITVESHRTSIKYLSNHYQTSIRPLSNIYRFTIKRLSNIYQTTVENNINVDAFLEVVTAFKCKMCTYLFQDKMQLLDQIQKQHLNSTVDIKVSSDLYSNYKSQF